MGRYPSMRQLCVRCFLFLLLAFKNEVPRHVISTPLLDEKEVDALNEIVQNSNGYTLGNINRDSCAESASFLASPPFTCDCSYNSNKTCHVTALYLRGQGLRGKFPPEVTSFKHLEVLDLSKNKFQGSIPDFLTNLSLTEIILSGNRFGGCIPSFLGTIRSLEYLSLYGNLFNGSIPANLGGLPSLRILNLALNNLTGQVPDALGNITTLEALSLTENRLSGVLPQQLGKLSSLRYLVLRGNQLSGQLPVNFTNLRMLEAL